MPRRSGLDISQRLYVVVDSRDVLVQQEPTVVVAQVEEAGLSSFGLFCRE